MAGGKETPRQKMIGMMYLVLTALLALQVSSAVLEKFAILNETMVTLVADGNDKSEKLLASIIKEAGKSTKPNVIRAKENAQKIRELTKETFKKIAQLKEQIFIAAKTTKVDEKFIHDHGSAVAAYMIDGGGGKQYEGWLNEYAKQVRDLSGLTEKEIPNLAKPPKENPLFASNKDHANKDFVTFTFENTPPIAALATVTQSETEILEIEAKALARLSELAGAGNITFDSFVVMVRPKSSVVAAGAQYEAEMFLSGSSTSFAPEFFQDGKSLSVTEEMGVKMGKVKFIASAGAYDPNGIAKKSFLGEIKINDTTFRQKIEYEVAQPIIKVTTGNVPTLYMNCGNAVNIEVPSLGTNYNPTFNANGADIVKGDKPGKVTIIPKQRKFKVNVANGSTPIGVQDFEAKNVPDPRYVAYIGSQPVDLRQGIKINQLANLKIVAEPDENFKTEVPKDARYKIKRAEVQLARGTSPVQRTTATSESPDVRSWSGSAKPGDRIVIEIKDVIRRTYQEQEEKVVPKGSAGIIIIPVI